MRAGLLRHRVTIEEPANTRNTFGEEIEDYSDLVEVYANVVPLGGRERFDREANQQVAEADHRMEIRYRAGLKPTYRVRWVDGAVTRYFDIEGLVEVNGRRRELHLMCKEILDG